MPEVGALLRHAAMRRGRIPVDSVEWVDARERSNNSPARPVHHVLSRRSVTATWSVNCRMISRSPPRLLYLFTADALISKYIIIVYHSLLAQLQVAR